MTPEEIIADLQAGNRDLLLSESECGVYSTDQVLALMGDAAMNGFKLGSNVALSMVKGSLVIQLNQTRSAKKDISDL